MNGLGRSAVVTTDSSTEGSIPGSTNLFYQNGMEEFSEEEVQRQFGATFNHPKNSATEYLDDLDYDEPNRHLADWYLLKRGKSQKKALAPIPDGPLTCLYELHGVLEPVKGLTKHPPIRVVIKDLKGWSLDRSSETRGIWIHSSYAFYKLMSPSYSVTDSGGSVTMHDLHVPFRAKFQLLSNLLDVFCEDNFRYLEMHISQTPRQVFDMLSPNQQLLARHPDLNTMPFDFELLKRCPAFIKQHLTNFHPKLTPSCQFMQGLDQMEREFTPPKKERPFDYMHSAFEAEKRASREPHGDIREGAPSPRPNMLIAILKGKRSPIEITPCGTISQTVQAQPLLTVQTPNLKANKTFDLQANPEVKSTRKNPPSTHLKSSFPHKKRSRDIINLTSDTSDSEEECHDDTEKITVRGSAEQRKSTHLSKVQPRAVKSYKQRRLSLSDSEYSHEKDSEGDSSHDHEQRRRGSVPKKSTVGSNQKVISADTCSSSFDEPIQSKASASLCKVEATIPARQLQLKGPALEPIQVIFESNNVATEQQIKHTLSRELNEYLDVKEGGILKEKAADFVADIVQAPKLASMVVVLVSIQALKKSGAQVHKQLFNCKKAENVAARIVFIRWFNKALQLIEDAGGKECMGSQIVVALLELMQDMKSVDCQRKLRAMAEKFEVDWLYCVDQAMALASKFKLRSVETVCYLVGAHLRILPEDSKKERKTITTTSPEKASQTAFSSPASENYSTPAILQPLPFKRSNSSVGNDSQLQIGTSQRETGTQAKKQQQTRLASMLQQARVQCIGRSLEKKEQEEFSIGPLDPGFEARDQDKINTNENSGFNKCGPHIEEMTFANNWGNNAWGSSNSWKASAAVTSGKAVNNSWSQAGKTAHPPVADEAKAYQCSSELEATYDATLPVKSWDCAVDDHTTNASKVLGGAWGSSFGWGTVKCKDSIKSVGWGQTSCKDKDNVASFSASLESDENMSDHVKEDASGRANIQETNIPNSISNTNGNKCAENTSRDNQFGGKDDLKSSSVSADMNDSLKKSGCVWGTSSGWNNKVSKDIEYSSGGWGPKKRIDHSWGVSTKGATASLPKGHSDQLIDSGVSSESVKVAIDANINSSKAIVLHSAVNATDDLKASVSKSTVSARVSRINNSSPSEMTKTGGLGQTWQGSEHKKETSETSKLGSNSTPASNIISKNSSSVKSAWGFSSGWGTSLKDSWTKSSAPSWGPAENSRRSYDSERGTTSTLIADKQPIAASGIDISSSKQDDAGTPLIDSNKIDAASTKKSGGAWGSTNSWATGSSKNSSKALWGQTRNCSSSSSATTLNVSVDNTGKINPNKGSVESVSDEQKGGSTSETYRLHDYSSSTSVSGMQTRESVPTVGHVDDTEKCSKRKSTLPLPEGEEDGEISEKIGRSALPLPIPEKRTLHDVQLRAPASTAGVTVTNQDVGSELSRGRGRGVDNRPAWMTSKGNESGSLDVEDRLSSTSSLSLTFGQLDESSLPRGRGRGICNLPAWQTHSDNVGNKSSTGQEDVQKYSLQVTSCSHGPAREAAERAAQRERNREELRLDRERYKVPKAQYHDGIEVVGYNRQDERYSSSRGISYSGGGDTRLNPERSSDRGSMQPQKGGYRSSERQYRRYSNSEDRRVESRQKDSEQFHSGYDRSMPQQQRWRR